MCTWCNVDSSCRIWLYDQISDIWSIVWCDSSSWTTYMCIHDMHLTYSCSSVDLLSLWLLLSQWVMNESFRSLLLSWVRLFLEFSDFHEVSRYSLSAFNDFLLIVHVNCSAHLMYQHCEDSLWYAHQVHNFFCSFLSLFQICSCIWTDCMKKDVFATQLAKRHDQISLTCWHVCYFLKNLLDNLLLHLLYFFFVCYLYHDFAFLVKRWWSLFETLLSCW